MTLIYLQNYWWLLISVLGALLVFLLFVQGGQSMLLETNNPLRRDLIVNSMGRKWELTFTTLVTFGGAFFASFPLFYSTSFGGAYWLWILILFSFVLQAVSYEYRRKKGNVYGTGTFDAFLFINGCVGCILLGVAVSMFFFGAEFQVNRGNLLDGSSPVISTWAPTHGFEAIFCWKNLVLGVAVLFLARTIACLYMMNNIADDPDFFAVLRKRALVNGGIFVVFFLGFLALVLTATGLRYTTDALGNETFTAVPYCYALLHRPVVGIGGSCHRCGDGALRRWTQRLCRTLDARNMVVRNRHRARGAQPLLGGRIQRHGLLSLAARPTVVAHHTQLLILAVHPHRHELCLDNNPLRSRIHSIRMACHGPQETHPRGTGTHRPQILTTIILT